MARYRFVLAFALVSGFLALPALAVPGDAPSNPEPVAAPEPLVTRNVALEAGNFQFAKGCEAMAGFTPCHRQMTTWSPARATVQG